MFMPTLSAPAVPQLAQSCFIFALRVDGAGVTNPRHFGQPTQDNLNLPRCEEEETHGAFNLSRTAAQWNDCSSGGDCDLVAFLGRCIECWIW